MKRRAVELARQAFGGDGDSQLYRVDTQPLPFGPRHAVLALHAAGAAARGDEIVRPTLRLGGHDADRSVTSFDDASSLLRGFPADAFFGTNVLLGNVGPGSRSPTFSAGSARGLSSSAPST